MTHRLAALIAIAALAPCAQARAETAFTNEAATARPRHFDLRVGVALGNDLRLAETEPVGGLVLLARMGLHERVALGLWAAAGLTREKYGNAGMATSEGGSLQGSVAGGPQLEVGLLRLAGDKLQVGVEAGLDARRLNAMGLDYDSLRLRGALQVSLRVLPVGLVYARAGFAWYRMDDSVRVTVRRLPYAVLGLEWLRGKVHPFLELAYGRVFVPYYDSQGTWSQDKLSAVFGVAIAL